MIRPIMFFLGLVFVVNTSPVFAKSTSQTKIESEFAEQFRKEMAASKIPGAAYVIVRGNKVSAMKTYGVRGQNDKRAINSETAFRLASVSKTFAAELAAMMISRKAFSWEDPIVKYIPEFQLKKAGQAEAIRIKHVLSQSSGLI
ncbi:MAG: serine hydrolase domain-containing protein, partial [Psychromonas sp.]